MARRLAPGIRVNCLAPGNVYFPSGNWDVKNQVNPQWVAALIEAAVPMLHFGTPEKIANAAMFLCSDRPCFVIGACLVVDGGHTVSMF